MSRPVMPSDMADVPAWLRANARRWSMRLLFLADDLAAHLERRQAIEAAAIETGVRLVDLPTGLTDAELQQFMADQIAATTGPAPATAPQALEVGNQVGNFVNDLLTPRPTVAPVPPFRYWCRECGIPFGSDHGAREHHRLNHAEAL